MFQKFAVTLSLLAVARSAAINPSTPSNSESINHLVPKTPAPIYETTDATHNKEKPLSHFSNEKYAQIANNGAYLTHTYPTIYSSPIHPSVYYNPGSYSVTPLVANTYSGPIYTQNHGIPILTKTYSTPVLTKPETTGLSTYSHAPIVQDHALKTTITYSEAPLVSHMTFTGLGTNYAW